MKDEKREIKMGKVILQKWGDKNTTIWPEKRFTKKINRSRKDRGGGGGIGVGLGNSEHEGGGTCQKEGGK